MTGERESCDVELLRFERAMKASSGSIATAMISALDPRSAVEDRADAAIVADRKAQLQLCRMSSSGRCSINDFSTKAFVKPLPKESFYLIGPCWKRMSCDTQ